MVDFYCPKLRLVIEVDGDSHFEPDNIVKDKQRQQWIEGLGIRVVRFTNDEVLEDTYGVLLNLKKVLIEPPHTPP